MKAHHARPALVLCLLAVACAPAGPAREAQAIRTAIDAGRRGCVTATAKRVELTPAQRAWCEGRP